MLVKHVNQNRFDVFFNNGWTNWARFEVTRGKLTQVSGTDVPKPIVSFLEKRYNKA